MILMVAEEGSRVILEGRLLATRLAKKFSILSSWLSPRMGTKIVTVPLLAGDKVLLTVEAT